jgi:hypothetical protein
MEEKTLKDKPPNSALRKKCFISNLIAVISGAIAVSSAFLPWLFKPGEFFTARLIGYQHPIILICAAMGAAVLILGLTGILSKIGYRKLLMFLGICQIVIVLIIALKYISAGSVEPRIGMFFAGAASIGTIIAGILVIKE